jgi:predicted Fe-Mo cluster-binding NifX family protein
MRLAVPIWEGRISPLLDVATRLMGVDVIGGEAAFTEIHPLARADRACAVTELGVNVLICGAITRDLEQRLVASGVEVIAEIRGDAREVVRAAIEGKLLQPCFLLPGSHSRRRSGRVRVRQREREEESTKEVNGHAPPSHRDGLERL